MLIALAFQLTSSWDSTDNKEMLFYRWATSISLHLEHADIATDNFCSSDRKNERHRYSVDPAQCNIRPGIWYALDCNRFGETREIRGSGWGQQWDSSCCSSKMLIRMERRRITAARWDRSSNNGTEMTESNRVWNSFRAEIIIDSATSCKWIRRKEGDLEILVDRTLQSRWEQWQSARLSARSVLIFIFKDEWSLMWPDPRTYLNVLLDKPLVRHRWQDVHRTLIRSWTARVSRDLKCASSLLWRRISSIWQLSLLLVIPLKLTQLNYQLFASLLANEVMDRSDFPGQSVPELISRLIFSSGTCEMKLS